ncbi:MAG: peptidylprolyl isomerase [Acidobacteriota bacterium]
MSDRLRPGLFLLVGLLSLPSPTFGGSASSLHRDPSLRLRALVIRAEDQRDAAAPGLAAALRHADPVLRARAARAHGRIGEGSSVPLLLPLLVDASRDVQAEALFALGEIESPAAAASLTQGLLSKDPELRSLAAEALSKLRLSDTQRRNAGAQVVARLLGSDAPVEQLVPTLRIVFRFGAETPGLNEALARHAEHPSAAVSEAALHSAFRLADDNLASTFVSAIGQARSPGILRQALRGLSRVARARSDENPAPTAWRNLALSLLRRERDHRPGPSWSRELSASELDPRIVVRVGALRFLASVEPLEDAAATALITEQLAASSHQVQRAALALAQAWKTKGLVPTLRELIRQPGRLDLRADALTALAATLGDEAGPDLQRAAADTDWRLRAAVANATGVDELATHASIQAVQDRLLADSDPRVLAPALAALDPKTHAGAPLALTSALGHADVVARAVAASRLPELVDAGKLKKAAADSALRRCLTASAKDELGDARVGSFEALTELHEDDLVGVLKLGLAHEDYNLRLRAREVARRKGLDELVEWPIAPVRTGRDIAFYRDAAVDEASGASRILRFHTRHGAVDVELALGDAILTVLRIEELASAGTFDGLGFHRVVPDFVVQGGDPRGDGWGGPGPTLRCEINRLPYRRGTMGMALSGKDTGGSQFFWCHSPQPHLNGGYTVFGAISEDSLPLVDRIRRFDRISRVESVAPKDEKR